MRKRMAVIGAGIACLVAATVGYSDVDVAKVADEIRIDATLPSQGPEGYPLPLMSAWCSGDFPAAAGWAPDQQMKWIEAGHFVMPVFSFPAFDQPPSAKTTAYYESAMKKARELRLPIVITGTQWEAILSYKGPWLSLPPDQNPNVVQPDGKIQPKVSPFGPVAPWAEVGKKWTDSPVMKQLQEWYPDPPMVMFLSNNEAQKLYWTHVDEDRRYVEKYGKGKSADFKRQVVAEGWIERYRAMQKGMRDALVSPEWKKNAIFVGYEGGGVPFIGRWGGWVEYGLNTPGRIDPTPLIWDGCSPSYYLNDWEPTTDYSGWSPQVQFMNMVFQKEDDLKLNPKFWYELSTWDGYQNNKDPKKDKRSYFASVGHPWSLERYAGVVQFGMWLLRPRALREFRGWTETYDATTAPYYEALLASVDRVHTHEILREFWRKGELVPNRAHAHFFQTDIPAEFAHRDRWFMLDASVNVQAYPWGLGTQISVFALALVKGQAPERQWLVYASSPLGPRKSVLLTIPGYRKITVDTAVAGSFCLVDEKSDGAVTEIQSQ